MAKKNKPTQFTVEQLAKVIANPSEISDDAIALRNIRRAAESLALALLNELPSGDFQDRAIAAVRQSIWYSEACIVERCIRFYKEQA